MNFLEAFNSSSSYTHWSWNIRRIWIEERDSSSRMLIPTSCPKRDTPRGTPRTVRVWRTRYGHMGNLRACLWVFPRSPSIFTHIYYQTQLYTNDRKYAKCGGLNVRTSLLSSIYTEPHEIISIQLAPLLQTPRIVIISQIQKIKTKSMKNRKKNHFFCSSLESIAPKF